jgi:hypothetical protein
MTHQREEYTTLLSWAGANPRALRHPAGLSPDWRIHSETLLGSTASRGFLAAGGSDFIRS